MADSLKCPGRVYQQRRRGITAPFYQQLLMSLIQNPYHISELNSNYGPKNCFFLLIIVMLIMGIFDLSKIVTDPRNTLTTETKPLIEDCKKLGDTPFTIKGDTIIYDVSMDKFVNSNKSTFISDKSKPYTVFLIYDKTDTVTGHYDVITPAIQRQLHVAIVYWPENKAVGIHSIMGEAPPPSYIICNGCSSSGTDNSDPKSVKSYEYSSKNVGSVINPLYKWIDSIPKS